MDSPQKVVMVLLILAILFSVVSVIISLGALNFNIPDRVVSQSEPSSQVGNIGLVVETSKAGGNPNG